MPVGRRTEIFKLSSAHRRLVWGLAGQHGFRHDLIADHSGMQNRLIADDFEDALVARYVRAQRGAGIATRQGTALPSGSEQNARAEATSYPSAVSFFLSGGRRTDKFVTNVE